LPIAEVIKLSQTNKRQNLFDRWASTYDEDLEGKEAFPFFGYDAVLQSMLTAAELQPGHRVLDVGVGTGNLARRLPIPVDQIWGLDFSAAMLEKARLALPAAHLIQADLVGEDWLAKIEQRFECILSAYTLHEFPDPLKIKILTKLAKNSLKADGAMIIGDISFQHQADYHFVRKKFFDSWDEDEYYWCAEPLAGMLNQAGFSVHYEQISICAGTYQLRWKGY
jgi:putative AdoMet-dependent methyltransferase